MNETSLPVQRAPRLLLPLGNVLLGDGRTLVWDRADSLRFLELRAANGQRGEVRVWRTIQHTPLAVFGSMDRTPRWGDLLHISFSYARRYPDWEEFKHLKAAFFGPDRDAMQVLPRDAMWVNAHENCFHLWQMPEAWDLS